jgi:hypothetical protein
LKSIATIVALLVGLAVAFAGPAAAVHSVASVSPSTVAQGRTGASFTVTGSGFSATGGAPVVSVSGTGVTVVSTTLVSSTQVTTKLTIAGNAPVGTRTLTVSQGPGGVDKANCTCLTIVNRPSITSFTPAAASNTGVVNMTVSGSHFVTGALISLLHQNQATMVSAASTVNPQGTTITAPIDLTGAPPGLKWSVVVTNPDGGKNTFGDQVNSGFVISGSAPTLTGVAPTSVGAGATGKVLTLTGTNLARGATVTFTPGGITVTATSWTSLTSMTATVDVAAGALAGPRTVTVTNTDTQAAAKANAITVNAGPSVTSLSPAAFGQGASAKAITIDGSNFVATPTVTVSGTGVTVANVTRVSATQLTAQVTVTPTAAVGTRNVTVTNPDAGSATLTGGLTVRAKPTVTSVVPPSRGQGASHQSLAINGTGFTNPATVAFSGTGITVHTVTTTSATKLTIDVSIAANATPGNRDVTVTNSDGGVGTGAAMFAVGNAPVLTTIAPNTIGQNTTGRTIVITGSGFVVTPTVTFSSAGVTATSVVRDSATQLTVKVDATAAASPGPSDVTVTNPDGGTVTKTDGITVGARPVVTSLAPSSIGRGFSGTVTVNGSAFQATPTLAITPATGVTITNVVRVSATKLTATLTVAANAATGPRDITVTNPDGGVSATCVGCESINAGPTITSITPNSGPNSGTTAITNLAGSGFASDATVVLARSGQPDVPMTNVVVDPSGTKITGNFDLSGGTGAPAAPGPWNVKVTNPSDGGTATLANGFTVTGSAPAVTTASPATLGQGASKTITLTGSNFAAGAAVSVSGTGITVGTTTVVSATRIDVVLTAAGNAALGARDVTVTNTDDQAGSCTGCLTVTAAPTVTSISPAAYGQGATSVSATITGTNFADPATVTVSGTGVSVSNVTVVNATSITLKLTVTSGAATGARDLTVTNADGGTGTKTGALTVNAGPTVTSLAPNSLGQGATNATVVVTGTNFVATPTVTFSGAGVTASSVTRDSATQLTLTVTVTSGAATGARDITVTNPDGGVVTKSGAFTVNAAPTFSSISPSSVARGQSNLAVTINGSGFQSTPTVTVSGTGVTVTSVNRTSATQLTAQLSATSGATSGPRNLVITNPDKGSVTATNAVTVTDRDLTFSPWTTVNSGVNSATAITSLAPTRLDAFYRGTGNNLVHKIYNNGVWATENLDGELTSAPAAVVSASGRIDVLARGTDNGLWQKTYISGSGWGGWSSIGGGLTSAPAVSSWGGGRLDVFVKGTDEGMWHAWFDGAWRGWESLGGPIASAPAAVSWGNSRIDVVARGTDNSILHKWFDGAWRGFESFGGAFIGDPAISSWGFDRLDIFAVAADHTLSWKTFNGSWTSFLPLSGTLGGGPSAVSWSSNRIDVVAQGTGGEFLWRTAT